MQRVAASTTISINANGYTNVEVELSAPDGYTFLCEAGYATNSLYVQVFNFHRVGGKNSINVGIKNVSSSTQTITVHVYGLFIKNNFA